MVILTFELCAPSFVLGFENAFFVSLISGIKAQRFTHGQGGRSTELLRVFLVTLGLARITSNQRSISLSPRVNILSREDNLIGPDLLLFWLVTKVFSYRFERYLKIISKPL